METKTFQKIYIITIILLLIFLTFTIGYVYKNKQYFMEDPLINALNKRYPQGDTTCQCFHTWEDKQEAFAFNKTHWWITSKWYDHMGAK